MIVEIIESILGVIASYIVSGISFSGYWGVWFFMALESACLPVPSEIIMPFAGYLVWTGKFSFWPVVIWGTIGNLAGSMAAYAVGYYGGRPFTEKYGKYILLSHHDLDMADKWFSKYGNPSIFFSRLLPVIRTFISLPAGIARMPFKKFCFYTTVGSLPFSILLTWAGLALGQNWANLKVYLRNLDWLIIIFVLLAGTAFVFFKVKNRAKNNNI
ncbi:MAG: DedA family protein [Candidatus Paceibacterota bacterium]|jgi:membrane protein DedA with SNARE-associated domain